MYFSLEIDIKATVTVLTINLEYGNKVLTLIFITLKGHKFEVMISTCCGRLWQIWLAAFLPPCSCDPPGIDR